MRRGAVLTEGNLKNAGRWIAFIPVGIMVSMVVRLAAFVLQNFLAWRNPPTEFGSSFIEGGLIYLLFGTSSGRYALFVFWNFLTEIAAVILAVKFSISVCPSRRDLIFKLLYIFIILLY